MANTKAEVGEDVGMCAGGRRHGRVDVMPISYLLQLANAALSNIFIHQQSAKLQLNSWPLFSYALASCGHRLPAYPM